MPPYLRRRPARQPALGITFPEGLGGLTLRLTAVLAVEGQPHLEVIRAAVLATEQKVRLRDERSFFGETSNRPEPSTRWSSITRADGL